MKKGFFAILTGILGAVLLSGCIKNEEEIFSGKLAEFDATSWNANSAGLTYPIMTRIPRLNNASGTSDSTLRRTAGTIRIRVNLIGAQSAKEETVGYKIFSTPDTAVSVPATISGQTPAAAAARLPLLDAVAGVHYAQLSGKVTIPANSSFGFIDIPVLNTGTAAEEARFIGLQLDSTGTILPAVNYGRLGLAIDQR
ncbi:MAG TPA: hypothetical protein VHK69_07665 [Chitinophagaceae bacterium]|jgi:hypothetical protein|nr:hypothetical protein [Chitinophagaceae bacterium]